MHTKSLAKYLGAVVLMTAMSVQAQNAPAPAAPAPAPVSNVLTVAQMSERVAAAEAQVGEDVRRISHLQDVARKEKDVVKLSCVNDKLVEVKAHMNLLDTAKVQFATTSSTSAEVARPAYDEVASEAEQIKNLRGQAEACIGVPDLYKQESDVDVQHPDFPDDPTNVDPFATDIEPPAYASPFS